MRRTLQYFLCCFIILISLTGSSESSEDTANLVTQTQAAQDETQSLSDCIDQNENRRSAVEACLETARKVRSDLAAVMQGNEPSSDYQGARTALDDLDEEIARAEGVLGQTAKGDEPTLTGAGIPGVDADDTPGELAGDEDSGPFTPGTGVEGGGPGSGTEEEIEEGEEEESPSPS